MGLFSSLFGGGGGTGSGGQVKIDQDSIRPFDVNSAVGLEARTNRINQATPFGNLTFSGPNRSNLRFKLSPRMQSLLDAQTRAGRASTNVGLNMLRTLPQSGDAATEAILQRLQPGMDQQDMRLRERLEQTGNPAAYGGADFSEGAFNELALQNQGFNDARQAAVLAGPQYQAQLAQTAGGLINGSPVSVPQFNFQGASPINVGGLGLGGYGAQLNAATAGGLANAQNAQANRSSIFGGLFDLAGAGIGAAFGGPAGAAAGGSFAKMLRGGR